MHTPLNPARTDLRAHVRNQLGAQARAFKLMAGTGLVALAASLAQPVVAQTPPTPQTPARAGGPMGGGMHGGMHGDMGGMPMFGGRHAERALDSVGASADQKTQLRQIRDAARTDLKPLRDAARELHRQMQALFAQPTVDARAVETLRLQLQANREQSSKRVTQAMLDASRVLTPEQRKQLADKMEQRRGMAQRHRAERESLEGTRRP
jgi:Spy/CpxP family protein refolding chaperone